MTMQHQHYTNTIPEAIAKWFDERPNPMSGRYVTHARTPEELRKEFLSDLQRRLDQQDEFLRRMKPSAAEAGRVARVRMELLSLHDYWKQVQIENPDAL